MNVWHWRWEQGTTPITDGANALEDLQAALEASGWRDSYQAMLAPQVINIYWDFQWIHPTRYVKRTNVLGPSGTAPDATTVTNLAAALEFRSDIATRRGSGTKHIAGIGGLTSAAGQISAPQLGAMDDFSVIHMLVPGVHGGFFRPIIFGRARPAYVDKHGNTHPALPVSTLPITSFNAQPTTRVMRRRTVGVGI